MEGIEISSENLADVFGELADQFDKKQCENDEKVFKWLSFENMINLTTNKAMIQLTINKA